MKLRVDYWLILLVRGRVLLLGEVFIDRKFGVILNEDVKIIKIGWVY